MRRSPQHERRQERRTGQAAAEPANPEIDARIAALEQKLDALRLNYTDRHPDIIGIHRIIAQLKEQKKAEAKAQKAQPAAAQVAQQNPFQQQLSVSLAAAEASVASIKARVAEYTRRLDALKAAVNAQPQVEAEYTQLTRDYDVTRANYERLLSRREQAQMSGEMESNASVMDFRVIDPPTVPSTPNAPNRPAADVDGHADRARRGHRRRLRAEPDQAHVQRREKAAGALRAAGVRNRGHGLDRLRSAASAEKGLIAFLLSFVSLLSAYGTIMAAFTLR